MYKLEQMNSDVSIQSKDVLQMKKQQTYRFFGRDILANQRAGFHWWGTSWGWWSTACTHPWHGSAELAPSTTSKKAILLSTLNATKVFFLLFFFLIKNSISNILFKYYWIFLTRKFQPNQNNLLYYFMCYTFDTFHSMSCQRSNYLTNEISVHRIMNCLLFTK